MHGPSCFPACGIFLDWGLSLSPCTGRQILSHCTTRGILAAALLCQAHASLTSSWREHNQGPSCCPLRSCPMGTEVMLFQAPTRCLFPGVLGLPVAVGAELGTPGSPAGASWHHRAAGMLTPTSPTSPVPCRRVSQTCIPV